MKQQDIIPTGIYRGKNGEERMVMNFFMFNSNRGNLRYMVKESKNNKRIKEDYVMTIKGFARWAEEVVA